MKTKSISTQKGFTLLELLMYVSGLLVIGSVLIILLVQFYSLYKEIVSAPRADRIGLLIVDRITKEIRSASRIDAINSQFNTIEGVLEIETQEDSTTINKRFFVENGIAKYQEDDEDPLNLSSKDFTVSNFNFQYVQSPVSEAIRFTMEIEYLAQNATQTKSYTGFAILRESCE